ncbi:MAG TPA: DUF2855 family protein [Polyangiales bacterium]|nr:DUF2855 family protein [Polyangiales bacterium]
MTEDFVVKRDQIDVTRWAPAQTRADPALASGEALLRVDRYALTSNNITYALLGELARYWDFFPTEAGWGRIPVWGLADVVASRTPELPTGERIFGYLPMSSFLKVQPARVTADTFNDASEHRRALPAIYQMYRRSVRGQDPQHEDTQSLRQPLAGTGFLIDHWLSENQLFGARQVVIGSASSKTALSTAFMLGRRAGRDFQIIGLTSARHRPFCERVGYYDRVVEYDAIDSLAGDIPSVFVDMSGAPRVRRAVHEHFRDALRFSSLVGLTHGDVSPSAALPGPQPQMFMAPTIIEQLRAARGAALLDVLNEANTTFFRSAKSWLEIQRLTGPTAVEAAYQRVRTGQVEPQHGVILSPR